MLPIKWNGMNHEILEDSNAGFICCLAYGLPCFAGRSIWENKDGSVEIYVSAEQPKGLPKEN